ncbi:MAG: succinate dehydrogenase, hydrophobic membrane anchor protein [Steroidobacteraceae bacterium]
MSLRSPLGRALGKGSAGEGAGHWLAQRVTSVALVPLGLWFVFSLTSLPSFLYGDVAMWLRRPWNAVLLLAFVLVLVWHSRLGIQVVIEDYVHGKGAKPAALLTSTLLHLLLAVALVFAIARVALRGTV